MTSINGEARFMNKKLWSIAALASLAISSANAVPINLGGSEKNLQQIVHDLAVDGSSSVNVVTDQYELDETWRVNSVFMPSSSIVVELAGYAGTNRFGLYDIHNPHARVELFGGAASAGATSLFNIDDDGRVYGATGFTGTTFSSNIFGFYLETLDGIWYSQSDLNHDGADHLVAYRGEGDVINSPFGKRVWSDESFLLAWEDLASNRWDQDYNDFVLFVSGVEGVTVPEPMSLGLFGLGLAGLAVTRRKKKAANAS